MIRKNKAQQLIQHGPKNYNKAINTACPLKKQYYTTVTHMS